jgi:WD40 repeat protein
MAEENKSASSLKLELAKEIKLPTIALAADLDEGRAFAACFDGSVSQVDLESAQVKKIAQHQSYASGVRFIRSRGQVVSSGYDGIIQWSDLDGKTVRSVQAHRFWSWEMDLSPDEKLVASCTGQYLAGGYKYEPAPEQEPSVKVFDAASGALLHSFSHTPPVLSLAFSPDSKLLAAANMMGEIRVWNLGTGQLDSSWTTPDFTSWGIIKSHHYIGGIYDLCFSPDGQSLYACGMGPMRDPMAGNGQQRWQRFSLKDKSKIAEIKEGDAGNGLMETLHFHPSKPRFVMAGRLAQGKWNVAIFEDAGALLGSVDSKMRVTDARFFPSGEKLLLAGGVSQERKKDGKYPEFGRLKIYSCAG